MEKEIHKERFRAKTSSGALIHKWGYSIAQEQIREKLKLLHEHENQWNTEMSIQDAIIKTAKRRKAKLSRMIANNMRYRNSLIEKLK